MKFRLLRLGHQYSHDARGIARSNWERGPRADDSSCTQSVHLYAIGVANAAKRSLFTALIFLSVPGALSSICILLHYLYYPLVQALDRARRPAGTVHHTVSYSILKAAVL